MSARLVIEGLPAFREAFHDLAKTLAADAQAIVREEGEDALEGMRGAYPSHTGNLRRGLSLRTSPAGTFAAGVTLTNRAPHASLYEFGTQVRKTAKGANRGAMSPGHVFIPGMERARRRVAARMEPLLKRQGLTVTGSAR